MLTMKRVPTMVSMNQEQSCGRNCLGNCCLPGATFPLYTFGRRNTLLRRSEDQVQHPPTNPGGPSAEETSLLDSLILSKWEDCNERGLFRYDVTLCETKILEGEYGFVAQLNEGRHSKKRPTEFRVDKVLQPFDPNKFNFTKVGQEEVLFRFEESADGVIDYFDNAPVEGSSPNVLVINVSPIEYGHILLVPRVMDCIPQRIDPDTLLLALHLTAEVNNVNFRVGYNSLGAFATINQLHFQAYYLEATFPLERAPTTFVCYPRGEGGVKVSQVVNYPVRTLVFEIGSSLEELADEVARACMILQDANIPYNMLIADRGAKIFVIPQCFAERQAKGEVDQVILDIRVNPAVWEISGHIILFRREDFEMATEDYAWKLLAEGSLSADRFEEVKSMYLLLPEERLMAHCSADVFEDDSVNVAYRNIGKVKAKVRKSMELQSLHQECILPRA
ncbi:unnamed protein product [Calypogeia fissa]